MKENLWEKYQSIEILAMDTKDGIGPRSYDQQLDTCQLLIDTYPNRYSKTALKIILNSYERISI
jgi:hypothetical protein